MTAILLTVEMGEIWLVLNKCIIKVLHNISDLGWGYLLGGTSSFKIGAPWTKLIFYHRLHQPECLSAIILVNVHFSQFEQVSYCVFSKLWVVCCMSMVTYHSAVTSEHSWVQLRHCGSRPWCVNKNFVQHVRPVFS